jgi:hypothetical protein
MLIRVEYGVKFGYEFCKMRVEWSRLRNVYHTEQAYFLFKYIVLSLNTRLLSRFYDKLSIYFFFHLPNAVYVFILLCQKICRKQDICSGKPHIHLCIYRPHHIYIYKKHWCKHQSHKPERFCELLKITYKESCLVTKYVFKDIETCKEEF